MLVRNSTKDISFLTRNAGKPLTSITPLDIEAAELLPVLANKWLPGSLVHRVVKVINTRNLYPNIIGLGEITRAKERINRTSF